MFYPVGYSLSNGVYSEFRFNEEKGVKIKSLTGVIRSHRTGYARELLIEACRQALKFWVIEPVLQCFRGMREVIGKERLSGMYGVLKFKVSNSSVL
jgi:hypothetical protein